MRNKRKRYIFACLLGVTLLFTMGFSIETRINIHAETIINYERSSLYQPDPENIKYALPKRSVPSSQPVIIEDQHIDKLTHTDETEANYEVTAFYLNVRAEADVTSKIIEVVTKGRILEVLKSTDTGWLELKNGGFINGNYAKLISRVTRQSAQVKKLSYEQTAEKIKSNSGLTEEQIAKIFKHTGLEGEGLEKAILEIENTYGINSFFTIAVMKLESGHGKSHIAKTKNNLFGLNAIDSNSYNSALSFKTKGESVQAFGHIISEFYFDKGLTSVETVASKYCEANSNWSALVKSIMNSDYKKISLSM